MRASYLVTQRQVGAECLDHSAIEGVHAGKMNYPSSLTLTHTHSHEQSPGLAVVVNTDDEHNASGSMGQSVILPNYTAFLSLS